MKAQIASYGSDKNKKWRKTIDVLGRYCRSAIGEDIWLSPNDRQKYQEGLRQNPASGEWELFLPITSIAETCPIKSIESKNRRSTIPKEIIARIGHGWKLFPDYSDLFAKFEPVLIINADRVRGELVRLRRGSCFSNHTKWAFLLFHDLLAVGPSWNLIKSCIYIYRPLETWAMTSFQSPKGKILIPWPAPCFFSYGGYDIFLSYWNVAVKTVERMNEQKCPIYLAYAWIDAATAVLSRERPILCLEQETPNTSTQMDEMGKELAKLASRLASKYSEMREKRDPRTDLVKEWLSRLAYLLLPEVSGIEEEAKENEIEDTVFKRFCNGELQKFWQKEVDFIEGYIMQIKEGLELNQANEGAENIQKA